MSSKTMNRIRKFISDNLCEDEMEVDLDFTERYLSQFESIDRQTIEVLIENGYQTKEQLLAFDIQEDLSMLPVLNMAQKSLLRKALKQFLEDEELDIKIHELKGDDSPNHSYVETLSPINKRKRDSGVAVQSSTKRLRSSTEKSLITNDGLGTRMRQLVNKRKPIHSSNSQTDSDNEPEFLTTVDPIRFRFGNDNQINGSKNSSTNALQSEEDDEFTEVVGIPIKGCPKTAGRNTPARFAAKSVKYRYQDTEEEAEEKPLVFETKSLRGRRSQIALPTPSPARDTRLGRRSIATPYSVSVKSEPNTGSKSSGKTSSSTHIPTPTELEVRERLAQKKALAQQKSGRRRR